MLRKIDWWGVVCLLFAGLFIWACEKDTRTAKTGDYVKAVYVIDLRTGKCIQLFNTGDYTSLMVVPRGNCEKDESNILLKR